MSITLRVNGEPQALDRAMTISGFLESLSIPSGSVVVERNRQILQRERFGEVILEDGDELEIVRFVGGG